MTDGTSTFERLRNFLAKAMRMSHVYQPVMIRELLRRGGTASTEAIARALLAEDRAQVDYYRLIVRNMVGRVLTKNRGIVERDKDHYRLDGFGTLTPKEVSELEAICDQRIASYLEKREDPWSHRRKSTGYVSGTQRYEILKRAHYRCELCGVSAEHKALEVDHIVPRNHGGSDEPHNLQALCYSCNAMKQDRDDTDFRGIAGSYHERQSGCVFCQVPEAGFLIEGGGVRVVVDPYLSNSLEAKYRGSGMPHERMFPAPVSPAALGYVDLVLCTHAHTDHMDPDTLRPLARRLAGLRVVVPAASLSIAESRTGITAPRLIGVDAGETHSLCDDRLKLHVFRAAHETLDCDAQGCHHFLGFGLDIGGRRIFHSGDTIPYLGQREEITAFMPDLALLPVNGRHDALRKRGIAGNLTLEEAVALTGDCGIPAMVPHHYGMFAFNTADPVQVAEAAARAPFQMIPAQYQQAIEATT